eukprot:6975136-Prorocentrum_lima.AAC.1
MLRQGPSTLQLRQAACLRPHLLPQLPHLVAEGGHLLTDRRHHLGTARRAEVPGPLLPHHRPDSLQRRPSPRARHT